MQNDISIWICGPFGKMGSTLREFLEDKNNIELTGIVSPEHLGSKCDFRGKQLDVFSSLEELADESQLPDVIVDFTVADVAFEGAKFAAKNNVHFVTGTTGFSELQRDEVIFAFSESNSNAIIASNFSVGAVLMMHFSAQAAKHFSHVEIVETHHTQKKDAPSGTAITTKKMILDGSNLEESHINIHSLRLPGALAHQQVHLSSPGEILRIEHDANDRKCFMPGIVLAIENVADIDGVSFSIEDLLFPQRS